MAITPAKDGRDCLERSALPRYLYRAPSLGAVEANAPARIWSYERKNMNRKLTALGLAIAAVLAMAAMSVSVASAAEFHSEVEHTILTGEQVGEDVFTVNAGTVKCKKANYEGTQAAKTTTTQTVKPTYSECVAFGFVNTPIDTNGCEYTFHTEGPTTDIVCPAGKSIVVTAFNCEVKVGSQNGLKTVSFKTEGAGTSRDVKTNVELAGIAYSQTSKSFPGCTAGNFTNGTYKGAATVKGETTTGVSVGVWYE
jgi:hypothetical protein